MAGKNNRDEIARRAKEQWEQEQERLRQAQSDRRSQAVYNSYQRNTDRVPDRTPATGMPTWKIAAQAKKNVEKGRAHGYTPPGNYSRPDTGGWKTNYEKYLQSAKAKSVTLGGDSDEVYNQFVQGLKNFTSGKAQKRQTQGVLPELTQQEKDNLASQIFKQFDAKTRSYSQPYNPVSLKEANDKAYDAWKRQTAQEYWAQNGNGEAMSEDTYKDITEGSQAKQYNKWLEQQRYQTAQDYYGQKEQTAKTQAARAQERADRAYQQLQGLGLSIPDGFPDEDGAWENHILQTYAPSSREYQLAQEMIDAKSQANEAWKAADQTGKWVKNYEDYLTTAQNMQKVYSYPQEVQDALLAYGQTATSGNDDARASTAREGALQVFQKYSIEPEEYELLAESAARDYNQRRGKKVQDFAKKFGGSGWAPAAWAASVLANTAGGVLGASQSLGQTLNPGSGQYNSPDVNAPGYLLSDFGGTVQKTQAEGLRNGIGGVGGAALSTLYSGVTSLADNIVRYGLGAATGTAGVTLGLAATSSFASSYREAAARGGDATQATLFGLASGALEVATEKFSLDNLLKMKSPETITQVLLQAAEQGGVEISEEEASYFGGLLADAIIMQDNSAYKTEIREYERQGLTTEEAKRIALQDALMEAANTAAVSFIAGAGMGGIQSGTRYAQNVQVGREIQNAGLTDLALEYARSMPEGSDAYRMATRPEGAKDQITQDSGAGRIGALATETLTEATRTIWDGNSIAQVMDAFNTIRNIGSDEDVKTALNLMMEKYYQAAANGEITQQQAQQIVADIVWRTSPQNFTIEQSEDGAAQAGQSPTPQTVSGLLGQEAQSQAAQGQAEAGLLPSGEENAQREALLDQLENYRQEMAQEAQGMGMAGLADTGESVGPEADLPTIAYDTPQTRGTAAQAQSTETAQEKSAKGKNGKLTATRAAVEAPAVTTGGDEITITGATVTEGGKLRLLSSSGEAYDPKTVHIQNLQMRQLYSQAAQYGGNVARNYISNYNGSQDVTEYTDGYNAFLTAGRLAARDNLTYEQAQAYNSYYEQKIGSRAAMEAFSVGRDSEGTQALAQRQTARLAEGSLTDRTSRKSEGQDALVEALSQWAKRTGVHLELLDSINAGGEKANGSFVAATLSMALSADSDNILQAFGHEAAEFVQAFSPEEKAALRQDLMEWWTNHESANSMDALIRKYRGAYSQVEGKKSYNDAADEIVNDALGALLTTDEGIESFAKWVYSDTGRTQAEKKTLVQRIKDAIARIVAGLKRLLKGKKLNGGTERFLNMELEQQEALRQKFYSAMDAAAKNAKEGNYWESGEEIRNSIKNTSGLSLAEQLKRLYNGELASSDSLYFGTTPASLDAVGLNEYPLVCNVSTLRKITTEKHNIPRRVLKNINSILSDALLAFTDGDRVGILTGDIDANGKPVLVAIQSGVMVDREPANIIKSIYGLDHPREWLKNQTNSGKQFTVLQNKERATRFLQTYGYLALVEGKNRSFDKRISQENTDVKKNFSLSLPVEETRDLIALHNLTEQNLNDALKLGGLPSPSIAITKADMGHSKYGPISLVFSKDTVDPEFYRRNKVYGSDAWTPTRPAVEYPVNGKKLQAIEREIHRLAGGAAVAGGIFGNSSALRSMGVDDTSSKSTEELAEALAQTDTARAAYLAAQGETLPPVKRAKNWDYYGNDALQTFIDRVGVQRLAEIEASLEMGENAADALGEETETISEILRDHYRKSGEAFLRSMAVKKKWTAAEIEAKRRERVNRAMENNVSLFTMENFARHAWEMYQDGGATKGEIDRLGTSEALRKAVDDKAVVEWVSGKMEGLLGEPGIYNGKDRYTPSGASRNFKQLHYDYTLDNLVRAMNETQSARGEGIWGASAGSLMAVATPEYRSIAEIRADKNRLRTASEEEYSQIQNSLRSQTDAIISAVQKTNKAITDNQFEEIDHIGTALLDGGKGAQTPASIRKAFLEYGYSLSDSLVNQIKALYGEVAKTPTEYFEAKPQRAVGFDEVLAAVVPDNASPELVQNLTGRGVNVVSYRANDEGDRLNKINAVDQAKFSLKSDSGTPSQEQRWATDFQLSAETRDAYNTAAKEVARTEAEVRAMVREAQASGALAGQMNQGRRMAKQNRTLQERLDASRETIKQLKAEVRAGNREAKTAERQLSAKEKELQRQRERMEAKLNRAEANLKAARQRLEDYRGIRDERDRRVQYRKEIEQTAGKLRTMLTENSQRRHIPEEMKGAVRDLLLGIDQSSATMSTSEGAARTKADERFLSGLERLRNLQVDSVENGGSIDMPPALRDMLSEQIRVFRYAMDQREAIRDGGIATLQGMSAAELQSLRDVVKAVYTSVNNANRILASSRFAYVSEAAEKTISELAQLGSYSMRADDAKNFLQWSNTNPWFAFQRFGAGGKAIFEGLQNGWDKLAFNSDAVKEYAASVYTTKEVKAWEKELHEVTLSSGRKITISTPQLMSLYELAKRPQALQHLLQGGARIGNVKNGKVTVAQTEAALLTQEDLTNLAKRLTTRQIEVADKLQSYMETQGAKWGNEVSMARFGYQAFGEKGYFPIQSDQTNLNAKDPGSQENSIFRLLNMSFNKSLTQNANNAIIVSDIFDVFSGHMTDMAKYNALAIPVLDAMKWYNYRTRSVNEQGQISTRSVQRSLETAYGRGGGNYFLNLMKDLNGVSDGGREDGFYNKMLSNYKVAAVAGNVRVALLQFTAYLRAGAVMNPKYLAKAITMGSSWREMEQYSGIAKWKALGFYDTNIGRGMREQIKHADTWKDWVNEKAMLGAEWGDRLTWGALWNACKAEIMDKQHLTGEALLQATALRFRDVVYQTQVVDSTLTRSQAMRSKSFVIKTSTSFMSEPTLSYNLLLQSYEQYREDVRRGMPRGKALAKHWRIFRPVLVAYLLGSVVGAAFESFWDAIRDDDRYQTFGEKFLEAFLGKDGNLVQDLNPLNKLPVLKEIFSWISGFGNSRLELEGLRNAWEFLGITAEELRLLLGKQDEPTELTYNGHMTAYGYIYKFLKAASSLTGLPVSNLTRDVIAIWNTVIGQPTGLVATTYAPTKEAEIQYAFQDGYLTRDEAITLLRQKVTKDNGKPITEDEAYWETVRWETGEGKNGRLLHAFEAKDEGEIQDALKELKEHGNDESKNQSAVKSVLKELYTGGQLDEAQAREYLAKYAGLSAEKEFYQLFEKWGYWMENDTAEGFTVYEDLHAAIDAGKDIKAAKAELVKNGFEEKTVDSQVLSYIGEAYKKGASRADTEKRLKKYCGMDKDEVYWKMREYDFKIANPKQGYEKYGSFDKAVRSGQNLKSAIKEYTSHGIEEKTLASQITRLYKDELVELAKKNKSKAADLQAKILNAYVALGYDRDQKLKDVQAWYKDTGKKK